MSPLSGSPTDVTKKLEDEFSTILQEGNPVRQTEKDILSCIKQAQKLEQELNKIEQDSVSQKCIDS